MLPDGKTWLKGRAWGVLASMNQMLDLSVVFKYLYTFLLLFFNFFTIPHTPLYNLSLCRNKENAHRMFYILFHITAASPLARQTDITYTS